MTTLEAGERHEELFEGLRAELAAQRADVDVGLVTRAFRFAAAAHEGQPRRSGEPVITHPVGVATSCVAPPLDAETIPAALLHEVVEDTGIDIATIRDEFGAAIAALVDGVTKL